MRSNPMACSVASIFLPTELSIDYLNQFVDPNMYTSGFIEQFRLELAEHARSPVLVAYK